MSRLGSSAGCELYQVNVRLPTERQKRMDARLARRLLPNSAASFRRPRGSAQKHRAPSGWGQQVAAGPGEGAWTSAPTSWVAE